MIYLLTLFISIVLFYTQFGRTILGLIIVFTGLVLQLVFTTWVGVLLLVIVISKIGG